MPTIDAQGNLHGSDGQFANKTQSAAGYDLSAAPVTDWRDQAIIAEGRRFTLGQASDQTGERRGLFHASKTPLPVGTVLVPQPKETRNFAQSPGDSVSITSDPLWANMWGRRAAKGGAPVYVYEVEPLGHVADHNTMPRGENVIVFEGRTPSARIVSVVDIDAIRAETHAAMEAQRADQAKPDYIEAHRMSDDGATYLAPDGRVLDIEDNGDGSEMVSCDGDPVGLIRPGRGEPHKARWQIAVVEDEDDDVYFEDTPFMTMMSGGRVKAVKRLAADTSPDK